MESDQKFNVLMLALPQLSSVGFVSIMLNQIKADTTIGQVIELIRKQTSYQKIQNFSCYGLKQELSKKINDLIPQLQVNNPRFTVEVLEKCQEISIKIESVTGGKIANLSIGRDEKVIEIKNKLQSECKYSIEAQKLFYKDQEIDDEQPLSYYNIINQDTVTISVTKGKGTDFSNLKQKSNLEQKNFSQDAPEWRIASYGLNLEGYCRNKTCKAFDKLIIDMKGYYVFNLITEKIKCPLCQQQVDPVTCGFYNCQWKYEGITKDDEDAVASRFRDAKGELYHRFQDDKKSQIEWNSLTIIARKIVAQPSVNQVPNGQPIKSYNDQCYICHKDFAALPSQTTVCGHNFHKECLSYWFDQQKAEGLPTLCPNCRNALD